MNKISTATVLIGLSVCCVIIVFILPPIPQDLSYHHFADTRKIFGISNFYNVISNLPFLILGLLGLFLFLRKNELTFSSISVLTLCVGITGIGIGSACYHFNPSNSTLVWDRIPMTITFMSFFSIILSNYVNQRWGSLILFPLLLIGIASVFSWYIGEKAGVGDLRLYALVQFYPMVFIPLIIFLYPTPKSIRIEIFGVIVLYVIAKIFERQDFAVYNTTKIISGHSIKHLFASGSILSILIMIKKKILVKS